MYVYSIFSTPTHAQEQKNPNHTIHTHTPQSMSANASSTDSQLHTHTHTHTHTTDSSDSDGEMYGNVRAEQLELRVAEDINSTLLMVNFTIPSIFRSSYSFGMYVRMFVCVCMCK